MNHPSQDGQPTASAADTRPPSHCVKNFTCNMALPEKLYMKHEFHTWDSTKNSPNFETWGRNFGAMVRQQPHGGDVQDLFEYLAGVTWGRHERPQHLPAPDRPTTVTDQASDRQQFKPTADTDQVQRNT